MCALLDLGTDSDDDFELDPLMKAKMDAEVEEFRRRLDGGGSWLAPSADGEDGSAAGAASSTEPVARRSGRGKGGGSAAAAQRVAQLAAGALGGAAAGEAATAAGPSQAAMRLAQSDDEIIARRDLPELQQLTRSLQSDRDTIETALAELQRRRKELNGRMTRVQEVIDDVILAP